MSLALFGAAPSQATQAASSVLLANGRSSDSMHVRGRTSRDAPPMLCTTSLEVVARVSSAR